MLAVLGTIPLAFGLLALGAPLKRVPYREPRHSEPPPQVSVHRTTPRRILMIRVSQESSPGAGDFDTHVLGFLRALQTLGTASNFYQYGKIGPNYGNSVPALASNTSHVFFVNAVDGVALVVVQNNTNHAEMGLGGIAHTRWELSGGSAKLLKVDDEGEAWTSFGGTVVEAEMEWAQENTDGLVFGALPVGFTILGQFTDPPKNLGGGWVAISDDGARIPLSLVPGQRVRFDVALHVQVKQDH